MYHPLADDESVAIGYAESMKDEEAIVVTVDTSAFKSYLFSNHIDALNRTEVVEMLREVLDTDILIEISKRFGLPFEMKSGKVVLNDIDELLRVHTNIASPMLECEDCDDDLDAVEDDITWDDEEFAPYDELDEFSEGV